MLLVLALLAPVVVYAGVGARNYGSMAGQPLNSPIVGMARTSTGLGYWLVAADGGVFNFGDAKFLGSRGGELLNSPIVGMAATHDDKGYWLVAADGGIFSYGTAPFHGSAGGLPLLRPIVGMAVAPNSAGYWLVASDGGIFTYGSIPFYGSRGGDLLNEPIVGMAATTNGGGYWLVARDGGIFSYGNAPFKGSMGGIPLISPVVGMAGHAGNDGYWLIARDGGVFAFNVPFYGSSGGATPNGPIVSAASTPAGDGYWLASSGGAVTPYSDMVKLTVTTLLDGLTIPWDIGFTPDGVLIFDERNSGQISAIVNGQRRILGTATDVFVNSESGMLGLVVDPDFANNRKILVCQSFKANGNPVDIRIYEWTITPDYLSAVRAPAPLVKGIPVGSGFHNGCRIRYGNDGMLWIGTGDAGVGTYPQDLSVTAGKVLRVDPATGGPAPGNPFANSTVYEYGHRNVQGIAARPGTSQMFSVEHGPHRDDEVNLLKPGGNSGWDPVPGYNQDVPMTDTVKFPNANRPVWATGFPTMATSGATFVTGKQWKNLEGSMLVACLNTRHLRAFYLDPAGKLLHHELVHQDDDRLRSPVQGPDGKLYVTTSNGKGTDKILVVTPS